ncbi:MAG TPA: hypothetical protein VEV17_01905 [Bryobacteraceae bacterium]|nr:hypothetical protein [Bryobacteraceae bacterium]
MFDAQQKSTGTGYTATAALLSMAFIFIPAILMVSRPFGYFALALAIGCSALCATLAWMLWRKFSRRSIPSIAIQKGRSEMAKSGLLAIPLLCAALGMPMVRAADFSSYRGMQFGMNLSSAAKQAGTSPTEARTVHQRPAVIQEMDYRYGSLSGALLEADPVRDTVLSFFNGELFRMVVTYDRFKTEGMTAEDMIQAVSVTYGTATRPSAEIAYHSIYGEIAPVIARWEDSQYAYNLVRSGDQTSFALILYSKRLDVLAQAAIKEAVRLDALEAPQREIEQQKRRDDEQRLSLEKARSVNKANFRP